MNFSQVLKKRHSIRSYRKKEIEPVKLKKLLELINQAPSAGNLQAYHIYIVKEQNYRDQLSLAAFGQNFIAQAPLVLVFMADLARSSSRYNQRGAELYAVQDATIACAYAQLVAQDLGLGSCWVGAFDEDRVRTLLRAPAEYKPIAIVPLGYGSIKGSRSQRKKVKDIYTQI